MRANTASCRDVRLELLLADDEASDEYRVAAGHVETCAACQQRLTALAAEPSWWDEAHTLLSGECQPRWEPDALQTEMLSDVAAESVESLHDRVLGLLGAPGHPEMLGRLGRYDIERVIGSGGMGVVLKAHDGELNRPIAIKLLAPHLAHTGAARSRFAREGRAAAAVVHEHVVAIYNVESGGPVPFLVMQYVPGRSLQSRVDDDGPLGVEEILRIGMQAAAGLAAAHRQGLVHRDVKPSNILLENQVERAVLTDFGLARAIDDASLTQTGILAGTPHYMSPEQATGGPIDLRSDLFSLGAVLYFMATGHPPFRAVGTLAVLHRICRENHRPVWQLNKDIPDQLCDIIDNLLEKKPTRRPANAEVVQQQLSQLLSRVQQCGLGRRRWHGWSGRRFRRRIAWTAALSVIAASIVAGAMLLPSTTQTNVNQVEAQAAESPRDENAIAIAGQIERDLLNGFEGLESAIRRANGETFFLQGTDEWNRELESVQHAVQQLESSIQAPIRPQKTQEVTKSKDLDN
jgi:serine/threonine protein kinase